MNRHDFLASLAPLASEGRVLEIGPGANPFLVGPNVEYLDVLDAAALKSRFEHEVGADVSRAPAIIHHVGRLEDVEARFDLIASCHNIEHHPDLIEHLRQVARHLTPDGLALFVIPDKRYCFDYFIPESSIAEVVGAHLEGRRTHSAADVIEHRALTTHNDPIRHWKGDHGEQTGLSGVRYAINELSGAGYIDVHAWQFTPESFGKIIQQLGALDLIDLQLARLGETPQWSNEFCAVLRRAE